MTVAAMIIIDGTERTAAMALNQGSSGVNVNPIPISNPMANQLGHGTLVGLYVLNAAMLNNPAYAAVWGEMFADNPIYILDTDTIYEPAD
ncbi:hypothetical protein [Rhizobium leguminosarum]|uniref:hypothetical protein n=1 Tax=Rhizobium leguminosarum TaxID=384 RepID=UPI0012F88987|nr:hypothetical protein [Rhizobium leguminosarum]MVO95072.1 hypothetical protein [Rhizobium leguminosarum bv. phaseoli]